MAYASNPNPLLPTVWVDHSLNYGTSSDPFSRILSTDESIMESMMPEEKPWTYSHQWSHLPDYNEYSPTELYHPTVINLLTKCISIHTVDS